MSDTQYERVLNRFRSQAHFCRVTGIKQSTVSSWKERGLIPSEHHEPILRKAHENKIALTIADFFSDDLGASADAGEGRAA